MKTIALPSMLGIVFALSLHTTPAQAIDETWVASNGGGAVCTRAAPCATFAAAHTATDIGGTIKCVDAANFGPVTITKTITIDCTGTNAGILASSTDSILVDAAASAVTLRGLSIHSAGAGLRGVSFINGGFLHIDQLRITGFPRSGISFTPGTSSAMLHVSDSVISLNGSPGLGGGIVVQPTGSAAARAVLTRVQADKNSNAGVLADGSSIANATIIVQVRDSVVSGNNGHGIAAITNTAFTAFVVDSSSSLLNGGDGIRAQGAAAVVHIGRSTVIGNGGGLIVASGGQILSYQNNQATGNGVDGAPTGVLTVK